MTATSLRKSDEPGTTTPQSPWSPPKIQVADLEEWSLLLHSTSRPVLVHLNADTTWLLQLPYPSSTTPPPGRSRFNILLDPWLQGPQSDVASWFSTQWHVVAPSVATITELNKLLRDTEGRPTASDTNNGHNQLSGSKAQPLAHQENALKQLEQLEPETEPGPSEEHGAVSFIDVVAISHEFTDHCHRATLEELPPSTPVFAADVAADLIRSWGHFDQVITTPALGSGVEWSRLTVGPLPDWVAIGRVITAGNALYYHAATLVAFDLQAGDGCEAVIYSPHGIDSKDLTEIESSRIKTLALLHGLHDVRIWMTKQLNLGALNGIKAVSACGAKYWVATHDEVKKGGGFIAPLLQRTSYTFKDALRHEEERLKHSVDKQLPPYQFIELGSGDGLVLM
ncbi:major facilitator superfamily protein [Pochonia chlamydosporia 170]|uniref:Major facilitator superfamily protein n=1 Tax=Pochonia chlamydosporia 170 TaxID=1380566 RepID=A0A179FY08_METCM|nr:major facilitator superfamily protein [Pochonia chlamydosporia 170]OAQ69933.1 major facilitator superfamily protein [Pochonia chlamydosporia 170]